MRAVRGVVNGILMVTLIKPIVRVMVGRWRKRVQESPAIGLQVQELIEAALVEELAVSGAEPEAAAEEIAEMVEEAEGRSALRLVLVAGLVIAATTAAAYGIAELRRRRRAAEAKARELVAVPIEGGEIESLEDVALEALAEEG